MIIKIKKINHLSELNNTTHQMDLTGIYGIFHPRNAEYIFFSAAHGTFSRVNYSLKEILTNTTKLTKFPVSYQIMDLNYEQVAI
jgi:hypothetical protein